MSRAGHRRLAAERDQREGADGAEERDERRQQVQPRPRAVGDDVLLARHLAEVGDGLQQAVGADAVGAVADLEATDELALDPRHEGEEQHQQVRQDQRLDDRDVRPVDHQPVFPAAATVAVAVPGSGAPRRLMRTAPAHQAARGAHAAAVLAVGRADDRRVTVGQAEADGVGVVEHDPAAPLVGQVRRAARRPRRASARAAPRAGSGPPAATPFAAGRHRSAWPRRAAPRAGRRARAARARRARPRERAERRADRPPCGRRRGPGEVGSSTPRCGRRRRRRTPTTRRRPGGCTAGRSRWVRPSRLV